MGQISLREDDEERLLASEDIQSQLIKINDSIQNRDAINKSSGQISEELHPIWVQLGQLQRSLSKMQDLEEQLDIALEINEELQIENAKLKSQIRELIIRVKEERTMNERLSRKQR